MKLQKHWYLGFLGLIGLYKIPTVLVFIDGGGHWLDLANLLWFLWFFHFIPEKQIET